MSAFLAGLFGALGVVAAVIVILLGLGVILLLILLSLLWQPPREIAFGEFSQPLRQWITLEEGGFDHRAIRRDLRGPYILAPIHSDGHEARFRMRQRVERREYRDIAQMRDVIIFRKATK
jgi:hypothetical protein